MRKTNRKPNTMKWKKCDDFYFLDLQGSGGMWICVKPSGKKWNWDLIGGSGASIHSSKREFENVYDASADAMGTVEELLNDWAHALLGAPRIHKARP